MLLLWFTHSSHCVLTPRDLSFCFSLNVAVGLPLVFSVCSSDEDMFPVVNSFFEDSSTASATRSLGVTTPSNGMSAVAHSTENTGAGSVVNKDMDKGGLTHLSVDKASPFVSSSEEYNGHGSSRDLGSLKYDLQVRYTVNVLNRTGAWQKSFFIKRSKSAV